jgi:hypothetical protein
MKKDKMIKVSYSTHWNAKVQASEENKSLKKYVEDLVERDGDDVVLDVTKVEPNMLIAVFDDICLEMVRREDKNLLTEDEINSFTSSIENIPFVGTV